MDSLPPAGAILPATLWNQFAAPLRSFVAKRAPREVETEDVLQDVFVRIQAQLPRLREADRVDAWIFQIARNVVADAHRERTRRAALAERAAVEDPAHLADDERSAEASLGACLVSIIRRLPGPYRQAIELTELSGMTQIDAAQLVGISTSGMKSRVQRGREHLAVIIREVCLIETDVRGRVIECDPRGGSVCGERVRPSSGSSDSMDMKTTTEPGTIETNATTNDAATGCCGGPAPKNSKACCALDADVKATGGSGCGCASKTAATTGKGCC